MCIYSAIILSQAFWFLISAHEKVITFQKTYIIDMYIAQRCIANESNVNKYGRRWEREVARIYPANAAYTQWS